LEKNWYWLQIISRIALLVCISLYFVPCATNIIRIINEGIYQEEINAETEGIGGMVYSEKEMLENQLVQGVPEPEEFSIPQMLAFSSYTIQSGDMIGFIASNFGLNQDTLISVNGISNTRSIPVGKKLLIPNQDGIMYTIQNGETIEDISTKYEVPVAAIVSANELFSQRANTGTNLFIPGAKLDSTKLQEINGDLFVWPVRGRITSRYGYRRSPITGVRGFHSGLDISANTGVPIRAPMAGRVISATWSDVFGNYVVLSHHSNYRTLYGHLSVIRTKPGAYVRLGEIIGEAGNTGQSTGSHLHFQVYKNGVTVNPLLLMN
jgi:murein DD-endopeptidase MepM/ murein hydrolase activator NlpD